MQAFRTYGQAKPHAKAKKAELAKGSAAAAMTAGQARAALAVFERLQSFYQCTGRRVSLFADVSEFTEAAGKFEGRTLGEAVQGYVRTEASVKRKDIKEAVEEYIKADEPRTKAGEGQRPQVSSKYHYNRAIMLRRSLAHFQTPPFATERRNIWTPSSRRLAE